MLDVKLDPIELRKYHMLLRAFRHHEREETTNSDMVHPSEWRKNQANKYSDNN